MGAPHGGNAVAFQQDTNIFNARERSWISGNHAGDSGNSTTGSEGPIRLGRKWRASPDVCKNLRFVKPALPNRVSDNFGATSKFELFHQIGFVRFHGLHTDLEAFRNVFVAIPLSD